MIEKQNPILYFRSQPTPKTVRVDAKYDLKIGGRVNYLNNLLIESQENSNLVLSTLITETREAVDSSENS